MHPKSFESEIAVTVKELERLKHEKAFLSSDSKIDSLTEILWKRLQDFKDDVKKGVFAHKRLMK